MAPRPGSAGALGAFELVVVRLLNLPVEIACRALDLLVLLPRPRLLYVYLRVWAAEIGRSPYRWPRAFETLRQLNAAGQRVNELVYGELPIFSALWLFWRAGVRRGSRVLDLGAGRGRPLIAAAWLGAAEARGVELLSAHVDATERVLASAGIRLETGDVKHAALATPTHVLLNWCGLSDETRSALELRLEALPAGTRFLAVAVKPGSPRMPILRTHLALFTWGFARVYLCERVA